MKQAKEIYEDLMATFSARSGFSMADSSDLAVRFYAAAAEIETLYTYSEWALAQSFPQTATGQYLDLHAELRGLKRKSAGKATGSIRFSLPDAREQAIAVPAGTVCITPGLVRFVTVSEAVIPAGSLFCDAPAAAEEAGEGGNVASGTITEMLLPPIGVSACVNPLPFTGGCAEESDESLRKRVLESFVRLPNGANAAFYEAFARAFAGVTGVQVLPRARGIGTVDVVVACAKDAEQETLLAQIAQRLSEVREIAVDVRVLPAAERPMDLSVTIWQEDGASAAEAVAAVETALAACFTGERLGKPVYLAELGRRIYETGLVKNYCITSPSADLPAEEGVLPTLGTLTVTEGE
ncbi:MAG: baseplate J/gp47 family protein [Oscillospiraceae bacterium]|nr:baseplate J/gp47 family protein [Oscillospiraceae bacterium]